MSEELAPGFSSIGFRIGPSEEAMGRLLEAVWGVGTTYPTASGQMFCVQGEYYRLWIHSGDDGSRPFLEGNPLAGVLASVEAINSSTLRLQLHGSEGEELYPVLVRSPHCRLEPPLAVDGQIRPFCISLIPSQFSLFDSVEELKEHPDLGQMAATAAIPTGLFGDQEAPEVMITGSVIWAELTTNDFTDDRFWTLRVDTYGGEYWVCLPREAIDGDPTGKIAAAAGMVTGSFPDLMPDPLPKEEDNPDEPGLDNEAVEARIRELTQEFLSSTEFDSFYYDLHFTKGMERLAKGVSMFQKGGSRAEVKEALRNRGTATPQLMEHYKHTMTHAPIVFAHIVMANTMLLEEGQSSPALVVIAFGPDAFEVMAKARGILSRVHFGDVSNQQEQELADLIEDENYVFGRRRPLPEWLVGNTEAYAADLWIPSMAVHGDHLRIEVALCYAEPGPQGLTAAIPAALVEKALNEQRKVTPPPLPTSSGPPPLPPGA